MGNYFKPWRRKIGVVTLVLACVFLGLRLRSLRMADTVAFLHAGSSKSLRSFDGRLEWHDDLWISGNMPQPVRWQSMTLSHYQWIWSIEKDTARLNVDVARQFGSSQRELVQIAFMVPYWSITIPLTMMSAWLLLSKLRRPKVQSAGEPVSEPAV
jgi:hypothetical protein